MQSLPGCVPRRFYSLDALRGIASVGVVFYHWRHFTPLAQSADVHQYPFYGIFGFFYNFGAKGPDLFFVLSGFVFFWLYSLKIAERGINFPDFAMLRFSRLYPLHFVTLLVVIAEQQICRHYYEGIRFVFETNANDFYHFVLQLFLVSNWWMQVSPFNGPEWSISIEVLMYVLFFALFRWTKVTPIKLLVMVLIGFFLIFIPSEEMVGRGVVGFFEGGLAFYLYVYCVRLGIFNKSWVFLPIFLLLLAGIILWNAHHLLLYHFLYNHLGEHWGFIFGKDVGGAIVLIASQLLVTMVLFPNIILTCALVETYRGTFGRRIAFFGDISYAVYLIHFPLQLVFILIAINYNVIDTFACSKVTFFAFWSILFPLSFFIYHYFEKPAQTYLRNRFLVQTKA